MPVSVHCKGQYRFDFYAMGCYRHLAEDRMAGTLADEVIPSASDFDGTERAPMRVAEARVTLGVVAARQGDVEQAILTMLPGIEEALIGAGAILVTAGVAIYAAREGLRGTMRQPSLQPQ